MPDRNTSVVYFEKPGPANTTRTLELARDRAQELNIQHVVIASSTGESGALAAEMMPGRNVVVVTHSTGFSGPNVQNLRPEFADRITAAGGKIITCQHALGGVGRSVRRKLGTYQLEEIIAFVLRTFSQGIKVVCEITIMSADTGAIPAGEEIIAIGGTGKGVDSAAVILSANAQDYFDLRVVELICKPR